MHTSDPHNVRYISAEVSVDGTPSLTLKEERIDYLSDLPIGFAEIETIQSGACASELYYFHRREINHPSRFETDLLDTEKKEYYLARNIRAGLVNEAQNLHRFCNVLHHSVFHEGFCRIRKAAPDNKRMPTMVQKYIPITTGGVVGFAREFPYVQFQEHLEEGVLAVRNPALICDEHSSATSINHETGWPPQCDRSREKNHKAKGTIGHTEFIGTAVQGIIRVPLDSLTPLPLHLQEFVESDLERRGRLLTLSEPLGCVFDAFGTLLASGERPQSVLIIGDGTSALNTVAFFQVFSPLTKIVVVGKYTEKLEGIRAINPRMIDAVHTDGTDFSSVAHRLELHTGDQRAALIMATVPIPEHVIPPLISDNGIVIWWAAKISELAPRFRETPLFRERFPYGGAPRAEFSAVSLLDYFVQHRPDVIEQYLSFPGLYDTYLDQQGVQDVTEWLKNDGRLVREVQTRHGAVTMALKPIIHLLVQRPEH